MEDLTIYLEYGAYLAGDKELKAWNTEHIGEPLAPLSRYNAMIEDRFSIVRGNLSNVGIEDDSSLFDLIGKCRKFYYLCRDCINSLVYVDTAFKLDGSEAFSPYDE